MLAAVLLHHGHAALCIHVSLHSLSGAERRIRRMHNLAARLLHVRHTHAA